MMIGQYSCCFLCLNDGELWSYLFVLLTVIILRSLTWKVASWLKPAAPLSVLRSAPQFLFHLEAFELVKAEGF